MGPSVHVDVAPRGGLVHCGVDGRRRRRNAIQEGRADVGRIGARIGVGVSPSRRLCGDGGGSRLASVTMQLTVVCRLLLRGRWQRRDRAEWSEADSVGAEL